MDGLRDTAVAVCATMIMCSVVSMMSPDERFERVIKTLLAAVMLVTVVTGVQGVDFSFFKEDFAGIEFDSRQSEFSNKVTDYACSAVENTSRDILALQLQAQGINCKNIQIEINTSSSGSISIERVTLQIESVTLYDEAKRIAKQVLGQETEVYITGEVN